MAHKAPGKAFRQGLSIKALFKRFSDDVAAEKQLAAWRWPDGVRCPKCDSDNIQERASRKPQPYRCRKCRKDFSVKTDTLMHNSPLGCQTWLIAIYQMTTDLKGVTRMKLHRDLDITQKSAWYLAHRIRETFEDDGVDFVGPVEVDNGIESFWSMLKRGYQGTCHRMSAEHLPRYVNEFAGRHNKRAEDTLMQMGSTVWNDVPQPPCATSQAL